MKVLLHICCAPCSLYAVRRLREEKEEVLGWFYNPNIHPYTEYMKRLTTLESYAKVSLLPLLVDREYDLEGFLRGALDRGKERCLFCYRLRLEKAFLKGSEMGVDWVSTTLLYSKYQRHEEIKTMGEELARKYGVPFLYRDFRKGWKEGIEESKALNMYRQPYCGCIFSEKERFRRE